MLPVFWEITEQFRLNGALTRAFYGDLMNSFPPVCGIVAEYNPFHSGHMFHIRRTRESLGGDAVIVCVMSGNFVQRGDFAVLDKYARAETAVRGGADLVLELPLAAALSSAEGFARGAVALLHGIGCRYLSFGAETADISLVQQAAEALNALPPAAGNRSGLSYAAYRQQELTALNPAAAAPTASESRSCFPVLQSVSASCSTAASASRYARAACQNVFPARIRMSFVFSFMLFSFLFSQWAEQSPAPTKAPLCKGSCQPSG